MKKIAVIILSMLALSACDVAHRTHIDSTIEGTLGDADPVGLDK